MTIPELVRQLIRGHLTCAPADEAALAYGRSLGLPHDLLEFYALSNGAYLHNTDEYGGNIRVNDRWWKWTVFPVRELRDVAQMYQVESTCPLFPKLRQWIAIVDVEDSDCLAVDVAPERRGQIVDCFHETITWEGYNSVIANSFAELLSRLMATSHPYWLEESFVKYGVH